MTDQPVTITPSPLDPQLAFAPAPMAAEAYNQIIAGLVPRSVTLVVVQFSLASGANGPLTTTAEERRADRVASGRDVEGGHLTMITQTFDFHIAGVEGTAVATGSAQFVVAVRTDLDPPEEFWRTFLPRNLRLFTHPPLRDLVASLAARANIVCAPLTSVFIKPNA